jgi:Ca-activated chloride channel family protein
MSWWTWVVQWLGSFHHGFAYPALLWLTGVLLVLAVAEVFVQRRRRRALAWLGSFPVLRTLVAEQPILRRLRAFCLAMGLSLLVTGSAGPQWGRDWDQPAAPGRDLVVVLDLSRSMFAEAPNRLERARAALGDLVDTAQRRGGHRLALVVFAGRARVVCPLTHDYDHFRDALSQLDASEPPPDLAPAADAPSGTRIGQALVLAVGLHDPRFRGAQDILLLSDGDDPAGDEEWRAGADEARAQHVPVYTVGIGTTQPSPIPVKDGFQLFGGKPVETQLELEPLWEIARLTGGSCCVEQEGPVPLGRVFREQIEPRGVHEDSDDALPLYRQQYVWFLGPALALLTLEMALGRPGSWAGRRRPKSAPRAATGTAPAVRAACLAVCLVTVALIGAGPAGDPVDLVRQGNAAYDRQDYAAAVDYYSAAEDRITDPGFVSFNKAAALYRLAGLPEGGSRRAGLYREAELHYRRCLEDAEGRRRAEALYGLGNSLLQQGRGADAYREAVRAYEQCLAQDDVAPDLAEDARHNLEVAKLLLLQARASKKDRDDEPDDQNEDPMKKPPQRPDHTQPGAAQQAVGTPSPNGDKVRTNVQQGEQPVRTTEAPPPGEGNTLPPVPDKDVLVPMAPEDAAAHLEKAAARVLRERREHRHLAARPPSAGVKDW